MVVDIGGGRSAQYMLLSQPTSSCVCGTRCTLMTPRRRCEVVLYLATRAAAGAAGASSSSASSAAAGTTAGAARGGILLVGDVVGEDD